MRLKEHAAPVSLGSPQFTTAECGPFLLTDAFFPADHKIPKHFHDRPVIGVTLRGEWDSLVGTTRLLNTHGMVHVEPAGDSHLNHFGHQKVHVFIIQPAPTEPSLQPFGPLLNTACQIHVGPHAVQLVERLRHELLEPDNLTTFAVESLSLELLVSASRGYRTATLPSRTWMARVLDYLHGCFLQRPSINELAGIAGVTPEHFNRQFRGLYRMGAAEYIRRLRLNWAAERLRIPAESIAEVAAAAGFADQSHFTRHFRRQFGVTPAAFRTRALTALTRREAAANGIQEKY